MSDDEDLMHVSTDAMRRKLFASTTKSKRKFADLSDSDSDDAPAFGFTAKKARFAACAVPLRRPLSPPLASTLVWMQGRRAKSTPSTE